MAISDKVQSFRRARASELEQFARVLKKYDVCDPAPIFEAANQLRNFEQVPKVHQADAVNYDYWGYVISNLTFYFTTVPKHTHPENVINLCLQLSVKVISDYNDFCKILDPYKSLEFNIVITGNHYKSSGQSIEVITSLHLDRHISSPDDNEPSEAHPIYHFQFGGRKLDKQYRDFGNALIFDSPRIVHYPMDIILGVDFVLSNFFAHTWREIRKDGEYINLLRDYQEFFWKPYAHTKASHWKPYEHQNVLWQPINIWPSLLKR